MFVFLITYDEPLCVSLNGYFNSHNLIDIIHLSYLFLVNEFSDLGPCEIQSYLSGEFSFS